MDKRSRTKQSSQTAVPQLWTGVFVAFIVVSFCCSLVSQGLNAGTSVFMTGRGYSTAASGILAMVFSLSAGIARLVTGPIIDKGKCSLTILVGIVVLTIGTIISIIADGMLAFALSRLLQGVGFAAATTAAATAAADVVPQERLGEGIGYYGLGQAFALSVGPAVALFLVGMDPSTNLFVGMTLVCIVGFVACCSARYERHPEQLPETCAYRQRLQSNEEVTKVAERNDAVASSDADGDDSNTEYAGPLQSALDSIIEPHALPGAIPMAILCPMFGFGIFFAGLYGTTLGYSNAGLFYTVSALAMIGVRLLSGKFMDTQPPLRIYLVAIVCGIAGFTLLYFASISELVFLLAGLPYGVCLGISLPLNQSVAVKNTPSNRWGAANALFLLFNDLGIGLSSAVWGVVNDAAGFQMSIVAVVVCQVLSYLVARVTYRTIGDNQTEE